MDELKSASDADIRKIIESEMALESHRIPPVPGIDAFDREKEINNKMTNESIFWSTFREMCSLPKNTPEYFAAIELHTKVTDIYSECLVRHMREKTIKVR